MLRWLRMNLTMTSLQKLYRSASNGSLQQKYSMPWRFLILWLQNAQSKIHFRLMKLRKCIYTPLTHLCTLQTNMKTEKKLKSGRWEAVTQSAVGHDPIDVCFIDDTVPTCLFLPSIWAVPLAAVWIKHARRSSRPSRGRVGRLVSGWTNPSAASSLLLLLLLNASVAASPQILLQPADGLTLTHFSASNVWNSGPRGQFGLC